MGIGDYRRLGLNAAAFCLLFHPNIILRSARALVPNHPEEVPAVEDPNKTHVKYSFVLLYLI